MSVWTEEVVSRLKTLCSEGRYSYGGIAQILNDEFGISIRRNACIGKAARLGVSNGRQPNSMSDDGMARLRRAVGKRGPYKPRITPRRPRAIKCGNGISIVEDTRPMLAPVSPQQVSLQFVPDAADIFLPFDYEVTSQGLTLFDLRDHHCRWPLGGPTEPAKFFCGGVAVDRRPYCAEHCRVAYYA
jgi:GcrA cell cycle regulator